MLRVIVRVRKEGEQEARDLEVPAEVPARDLVPMVAQALKWSEAAAEPGLEVEAQPLGRVLRAGESLADAGVWDGAALLFRPARQAQAQALRAAWLESEGGRRYPLLQSDVHIGRSWGEEGGRGGAAGLVDLSHEPRARTVSRSHVRLTYKDDRWLLVPFAQTTNPTWLNGRLASPGEAYALADGDRLQLGDVRLRFRLEEVNHS